MALLETWRNLAYGNGLNDKEKEKLWNGYFTIEKGIYEQILSEPTQVITGTVKELAEKYNTEILIMTGFLDGINESLKGYENPIDTMERILRLRLRLIQRSCIIIWLRQRHSGCTSCPSGILSSARREEKSFTSSRRLPVRFVRKRRFSPTIRVRAEAARSTRSAAAKMHNGSGVHTVNPN